MNPRHLELADEFCKLVGKTDLLQYLAIEDGVSSESARTALKKKRKYMQGMQSNPKYKNEALFLIKNFAALDALLQDPHGYQQAVSRQQESAHLPILEMTIRTVLKGGSLSLEQEDYLRRQARELGLSEQTFEDTLTRLAAQAGISRPASDGTSKGDDDEAAIDDNVEITDHYGLLGIKAQATREEVYDAYRSRYRTVRAMADREKAEALYKRLDRAWQVLSDPASRETYDLSLRQTGPPARDRAKEDPFIEALRQAPTAPPVKSRDAAPSAQPTVTPAPLVQPGRSRIEFHGPRVRQVRMGRQVYEASLEVRVGEALEARVTADEPWLQVEPSRLSVDERDHTLRVRIDPADLPARAATGVVTVQTDEGDRASIVFEVRRNRSWVPAIAAVAGVVGLLLVVVLLAGQGWFKPADTSVTITIDPTAEDVLVDGVSVGGGSHVIIPEVPDQPVTLTVLQPNFTTWIQQIDLASHRGGSVPVRLQLESDLSYTPPEDAIQGAVDEAAVQQVMAPRTKAMDDCVRGATGQGPLAGKVRIFVGPEGNAVGVQMEGGGTDDPTVRDCLLRQAGAVLLPPLGDGDYATVRYDYEVAEGSP